MKVTTERLPKSLIALDIELDQKQVDQGLERAARKLSQQYTIPGFRPGKAPRFIIENYLGRARLMEQASDDLINKAFQEALKQEQITPIGRANLENVEEEPFRFRVTVPVEPSIELPDYHGYRLPYEPEPVSDETVARLLDAQREQHVVLRELDEPRPAQAGDMVTAIVNSELEEDEEDVEDAAEESSEDAPSAELAQDETASAVDDAPEAAFADEVDIEDEVELDVDEDSEEAAAELDEDDALIAELGEQEDEGEEAGEESRFALVEGRIRPEFFEALVGAQPGETRTVTVHYDDDEEDENLRGRTVDYTLEIKNIQERLLPEWDELPTLTEFDGDIDALRANARTRLERASSDRARRALIDGFVERAIAETEIDLPDALIEERAAQMFHEQVAQFSRYGITEEQYLSTMGKTHEEAVGEFHEAAEPDVRRRLVLRELIRGEGLQIGDEDLATETERFLEDYDQARREEVRGMLAEPNMQTMLASAALDRKLGERLIQIATNPEPGTTQSTETLTAEQHSRTYDSGASSAEDVEATASETIAADQTDAPAAESSTSGDSGGTDADEQDAVKEGSVS